MLEIEDYYEIDQVEDLEIWKREYNIPPREMAPVVLEGHGRRRVTAGLWTLLGPWAESLEQANQASTFNAKAETLTIRPAYRNAFLKRRCVVPAEAFYEWIGPKKARQPLNIARADGKLLSLAALFNYWRPAASKGRPMLTFTIVTTEPNQWMARIHNRMPVILQDADIDTWLDPAVSNPQQLGELLKAPPEGFLDCYPISRKINSVQFDEAEHAEKVDLDYAGLLKQES
jgi:putative SOS response-associated peptidase YedK